MRFDIVVNGRAIDKYADSYGNAFIEGRKGSAYEIKVTNNSYRKLKAVIAVDGKNILTGDQKWDRGYVLGLNHSMLIPGWRINKDKVAKFIFAESKDGYAVGSTDNCGVIGVKFFTEVIRQVPFTLDGAFTGQDTIRLKSSSLRGIPIGAASMGVNSPSSNSAGMTWGDSFADASQDEKLATGWGEEEAFKTAEDNSKFESYPVSTQALYYATAKELAKRGIHVNTRTVPNPFPENDFGCAPPNKG